MSDGAAEDPGVPRDSDPALQFEPLVGTVVEVSEELDVVVEVVGPSGECLRCKAVVTIPIDPSMVGQPVELTFIEGHLERPVVTRQFDMQAVFRAQWDELGRKALGLDAQPHKLTELLEGTCELACTAMMLGVAGNVTRGAEITGTSRRRFREHVRQWTLSNPHFAPMIEALDGRRRESKARMRSARSVRAEGPHARDQQGEGGGAVSTASVHEADCAVGRSGLGVHEEGTR